MINITTGTVVAATLSAAVVSQIGVSLASESVFVLVLLNIIMGLLGSFLSVVLLPTIRHAKTYARKTQLCYGFVSVILSIIVFRLGDDPVLTGNEWLDMVVDLVWNHPQDIRCFFVGIMLPQIIRKVKL